jgi:hypothetical protein
MDVITKWFPSEYYTLVHLLKILVIYHKVVNNTYIVPDPAGTGRHHALATPKPPYHGIERKLFMPCRPDFGIIS